MPEIASVAAGDRDDHHASFDKLRMRDFLRATKTNPHPELVEGRTAEMQSGAWTSAVDREAAREGVHAREDGRLDGGRVAGAKGFQHLRDEVADGFELEHAEAAGGGGADAEAQAGHHLEVGGVGGDRVHVGDDAGALEGLSGGL